MAILNGIYYLASNTGIYSISKNGAPELIQDTEDHVWCLDVLDNQIVAGHKNGTLIIEQRSLIEKVGDKGAFCTTPVPDAEQTYLQGTYYGINRLRKRNGQWSSVELNEVSFLVENIVFESKNVIWAAHPYKGIFRIKLSNDYSKVLKIDGYGGNESLPQNKTQVYNINDNVILHTSLKKISNPKG